MLPVSSQTSAFFFALITKRAVRDFYEVPMDPDERQLESARYGLVEINHDAQPIFDAKTGK